jgi:CBS domain-containing protein
MLSNKVSEIMTTDLVKAKVSATVDSVMATMVAEDVGRLIITDDEVPVGIFTEKDVLKRVVGTAIDAKRASIREVMTAPVRAVREETHIVDAFARMYRGKYRHLLVRGRHGKIIGIVSMRRILNIAVELGQGISESRTVGDIPTAPIVSVDESSTVQTTVNLMNQQSLTAVVVTTAGRPTGIFTERDVLKRVATVELDRQNTTVSQVMTAPLVSLALVLMAYSKELGEWFFSYASHWGGWTNSAAIVFVIGVLYGTFRTFDLLVNTSFWYFFNDVVPQSCNSSGARPRASELCDPLSLIMNDVTSPHGVV